MDTWAQRFGGGSIVSAFDWVVLRTILQWQVSDQITPSSALIGVVAFTGGFAVATFGTTIVTVLMQWSHRLEQSELSKRWHDPD